MKDACHGHHQVRIIIRLRVRSVFEEMLVEELVVELLILEILSSELLSISAVLLANGRTCCVHTGMSTRSRHTHRWWSCGRPAAAAGWDREVVERGLTVGWGATGGNRRRPWQQWRAERATASGREKLGKGGRMPLAGRFHLGLGRTRGARGRMHGLSGQTHFGSKSKIKMGVRGQL
jgi:hypothetical protein